MAHSPRSSNQRPRNTASDDRDGQRHDGEVDGHDGDRQRHDGNGQRRDDARADEPHEISAQGWKAISKRVGQEITDDRLPVVAAGLGFYAMLAVFPALIALVSIYGLVADPSDIQDQISNLAETLPAGAATLIETQLQNIIDTSTGALGWTAVIAILGALWTASSGTQQLVKAINAAYDETEQRGFLKLRGVSIAMTLGFMVLAIISLGLIVVVPPLLANLEVATGLEWLIEIGRFVLLGAAMVVALTAIYRFAPNRDEPRWEWVSWGSVIAVVIWLIASILFSVYVGNFGTFGETYGSLAGVIVLLLWFYISAFIILLGAEINSEMEHQTEQDTTRGEPEPMGERDARKADTTPRHDGR